MSVGVRSTRSCDVLVIGGGLIGLAIALELSDRGASVTVVERGRSLGGASTAAAGMLAAEDPGNPAEVRALSRLSIERYPGFLRRIEALSGVAVPFQTEATVQYREGGLAERLAERSVDPRQLAAGVRAAVRATPVRMLEETQVVGIERGVGGTLVRLGGGEVMRAGAVVYAAGAWTAEAMRELGGGGLGIAPRKGQMLRVRMPFALDEVHRSERIYIVPRTRGPQAGTALIGATVEDVGFDTAVHGADLSALRALAAELLPGLASEREAPMVEGWAGLRPATADGLPLLGAWGSAGEFVASGHYRNGILQAPGTAVVMADLIEGKAAGMEVAAFSPQRFAMATTA